MRRCELCKSAARMYCESDQASLCWDCDAKVHSANFLVARHSRTLLCHSCQNPTPWSSSGAKPFPAVSACESCVHGCDRAPSLDEESDAGNGVEMDTENDEYDDDDEEEEDQIDDDDEEDGDNQVVPWSSSTPPPPAESSSSSDECSSRFDYGDGAVSLKRWHNNAADLFSDGDHGCSSSHLKNISPPVEAWFDSFNALKRRRTGMNRSGSVHYGPAGSENTDLTSANNAAAATVEICKPRTNPRAVDPEVAGLDVV